MYTPDIVKQSIRVDEGFNDAYEKLKPKETIIEHVLKLFLKELRISFYERQNPIAWLSARWIYLDLLFGLLAFSPNLRSMTLPSEDNSPKATCSSQFGGERFRIIESGREGEQMSTVIEALTLLNSPEVF